VSQNATHGKVNSELTVEKMDQFQICNEGIRLVVDVDVDEYVIRVRVQTRRLDTRCLDLQQTHQLRTYSF